MCMQSIGNSSSRKFYMDCCDTEKLLKWNLIGNATRNQYIRYWSIIGKIWSCYILVYSQKLFWFLTWREICIQIRTVWNLRAFSASKVSHMDRLKLRILVSGKCKCSHYHNSWKYASVSFSHVKDRKILFTIWDDTSQMKFEAVMFLV